MTRLPNRLDELLRHWAGQRAAEPVALDRLAEQIRARLVSDEREAAPTTDQPPGASPRLAGERPGVSPPVAASMAQPPAVRQHPASLRWLAVAAGLLLALGLWGAVSWRSWFPHPDSVAVRPDAITPECARFDAQSLRAAATLLSELNRLFDQRLEWVAETDGQVHVNIAEPEANPNGRPALVVRIAVVRRGSASSVAQVIWSAQLVAGDQHVIRFDDAPTGARAGANLFFWAYTLPDGRIAVDSDLALAGPVPVQAESTGLQTDGVPAKVYTMRQGREQYDVYQTVAVLKGKVS